MDGRRGAGVFRLTRGALFRKSRLFRKALTCSESRVAYPESPAAAALHNESVLHNGTPGCTTGRGAANEG